MNGRPHQSHSVEVLGLRPPQPAQVVTESGRSGSTNVGDDETQTSRCGCTPPNRGQLKMLEARPHRTPLPEVEGDLSAQIEAPAVQAALRDPAPRVRMPPLAEPSEEPRETCMATVIAVANQKGGVGKTTTTANLGAALALRGKRVLLVDLDPQGNLTSAFGLEKDVQQTVAESLLDRRVPLPVVSVANGSAGAHANVRKLSV